MAEVYRRQQNKTTADSHFITLNGRGKSFLSGPSWQVLARPCRILSVAPCPRSCCLREKCTKHPDRQQGSVNQHEGGVCWERWECLFKMRGQLSELFSLINVILGHFTFHFNWSCNWWDSWDKYLWMAQEPTGKAWMPVGPVSSFSFGFRCSYREQNGSQGCTELVY